MSVRQYRCFTRKNRGRTPGALVLLFAACIVCVASNHAQADDLESLQQPAPPAAQSAPVPPATASEKDSSPTEPASGADQASTPETGPVPAAIAPATPGEANAAKSAAAASSRALTAPSPLYTKALQFAQSTLRFSAAEAKTFAEHVQAHGASASALDRYKWAEAQFDHKLPGSHEAALKLGDQLAGLNQAAFHAFEKDIEYGRGTLHLPRAAALELAAAVLEQGGGREVRDRFKWALENSGSKKPEELENALNMGFEIAHLDDVKLKRYKEAFSYAHSSDELGLSPLEARLFALRSTHPGAYDLRDDYFESHRAAFHDVTRQGVINDEHQPTHLLPKFARIVADDAAHFSPSQLRRFRWVLDNVPAATQDQLKNALIIANRVARGSEADFLRARQELGEYASNHSAFTSGLRQRYPRGNANLSGASSEPGADYAENSDDLVTLGGGCGATAPESYQVLAHTIPGLPAAMAVMNAFNRQNAPKITETAAANLQRSIRIASETFTLPEKFLYCLYKNESGYRPAVLNGERLSSTGARGIAQIMPGTFEGLCHKINTPSTEMSRRWAIYANYNRSLEIPVPATTCGGMSRNSFNPVWGIGGGAALCKENFDLFTGRKGAQDAAQGKFDFGDLAMLAAGYNTGMGRIKRLCQPGAYGACLQTLRAHAASDMPFLKETIGEMEFVHNCLKK